MTEESPKNKLLRIWVTKEQLDSIEAMAKKRGVSVSDLVLFLLGMAALREAVAPSTTMTTTPHGVDSETG